MQGAIMFLIGVLFCFVTMSILAGVSYSTAFNLGRAAGMCQGTLIAAKWLCKKRAPKEMGSPPQQTPNTQRDEMGSYSSG